jgi:hypothetical protein
LLSGEHDRLRIAFSLECSGIGSLRLLIQTWRNRFRRRLNICYHDLGITKTMQKISSLQSR